MKAFEAFEPEKIIKVNYLLGIADFIIESQPTHIYLIKKSLSYASLTYSNEYPPIYR